MIKHSLPGKNVTAGFPCPLLYIRAAVSRRDRGRGPRKLDQMTRGRGCGEGAKERTTRRGGADRERELVRGSGNHI